MQIRTRSVRAPHSILKARTYTHKNTHSLAHTHTITYSFFETRFGDSDSELGVFYNILCSRERQIDGIQFQSIAIDRNVFRFIVCGCMCVCVRVRLIVFLCVQLMSFGISEVLCQFCERSSSQDVVRLFRECTFECMRACLI